jgi:hypothetical protein
LSCRPALLACSATVNGIGRLAITSQVLVFQGGNEASSFVAFCLNLLKQGLVSTFSNFGFSSFATINGIVLGSKLTGLYVLGGDTDEGVHIASSASFSLSKFGVITKKQVRSVRLISRSDGNLTVVIEDGNDHFWSKQYVFGGQRKAESVLEFFPFTTRGRVLQVRVDNVSGSYFLLDYAEVAMYYLGEI